MPTLVKSKHIGTERDLWLFLAHWVSDCVLWSTNASSEAPGGCQDSKEQKADRCLDFLPYFYRRAMSLLGVYRIAMSLLS